MANLTDTTMFRKINSETLMYNADNVDTLINGLSATYANKNDVYTKSEVYTKGEIDGKITGVYHFKGSVETFDELLPLSATAQVGDTYNVSDSGKNYAWTGSATAFESGWDALGGIFDLEDYYTVEEVDSALSAKAGNTSFATLKTIEEMPISGYTLDDFVGKYNEMVSILNAIGNALNPS